MMTSKTNEDMLLEGFVEQFPVIGPDPSPADLDRFREFVYTWGSVLYRDLPWRNTRDPYGIWISEAMLQQTQVSRVLTRWTRFLGKFPTVDALAMASVSDVVEEWQGLGYNRRALALKSAADECSARLGGRLPTSYEGLIGLPGIGPATAAGILAFSQDEPGVYLETNVRAVHIASFFPDAQRVSDGQLRAIVARTCPEFGVRDWYYALLDVGVMAKKAFGNPSRKAAAYTRQSKFEGSQRQKRAELLRIVMANPGITTAGAAQILCDFEVSRGRGDVSIEAVEALLATLESEGFFHCAEGRWLV